MGYRGTKRQTTGWTFRVCLKNRRKTYSWAFEPLTSVAPLGLWLKATGAVKNVFSKQVRSYTLGGKIGYNIGYESTEMH